jgi:hypothetical protein
LDKLKISDLNNKEIITFDKSLSISRDTVFYGDITIDKELPSINISDGSLKYFKGQFILSNDMIVLGGGIINTFNKLSIEKSQTIELTAKISFLILQHDNMVLKIKGNYKQGVSKKIVSYKNNYSCIINFDGLEIKLTNNIEVLYDGKNWIEI